MLHAARLIAASRGPQLTGAPDFPAARRSSTAASSAEIFQSGK